MNSICIVTDSSAQFTRPNFPGLENIKVIPLKVSLNGETLDSNKGIKSIKMPNSATDVLAPQVIAPTTEELRKFFLSLSNHYNEILAIFLSSSLNQCFHNAQKAIAVMNGRLNITLIDSQTTSFGLGLLVQKVAEASTKNLSLTELERIARHQVHQTYGVICAPGLSYLSHWGVLDKAQASVGEMLNLFPIFTIEEGKLIPVEKVKNSRQALLYFQEYIEEFDEVENIALAQAPPYSPHDTRLLREYIQNHFTTTTFTEHSTNLPMAALLGPRSLGLFLVDALDE
jgi:DegV family protein with EDD domain